ncbi:cytoplasmic protein [Thermodesulfobacteriota bacterium]
MLKKDLILRNPLQHLTQECEDILPHGGFGAVVARAGVGKTALLVQLALNSLLRSKNVLHISLGDPIKKVNLWYEEVFNRIARQCENAQMTRIWEEILPHRFIMTFQVDDFSVPKLEERLTDLMEQNIFSPQTIMIDGFPFDASVHSSFSDLKTLAKNQSMHVWFTVRSHRHEEPGTDGEPVQISGIADLFEVIIHLRPEKDEINVQTLKGGPVGADFPILKLDPETMLLVNTP